MGKNKLILWLIILLYIMPAFIGVDFNNDLTVNNIGVGLPRVISGDEPHYFIALNSLIDDGDFLIKNNHAKAQLNRTCDGGFTFKGSAQLTKERRAMYTKNYKDYTLELIDLGGNRLPGKENVDLEQFDHVTLAPIGLPIESALFLWPFSNTCTREHFAIFLSIFISIIGILFFYKTIAHYHNPHTAMVTTFIYAFGTPLWFYSKTFFAEPYLATFLILAYYYLVIESRPFWSGFFIGAGYLMKQPFSLLLPLFVLYKLHTKKLLGGCLLVLGFVPFLLIFFGFNIHYFSTLTTPAKQFTAGNIFVGMYNNVFSSTQGLFWFSPIILFSFLGIIGFYKKNKIHCILVCTTLIVYFLLFSLFLATGGAYSSRYSVPFIPFMMVLLSFAYSRIVAKPRLFKIFLFLGVISVLINLQAAVAYILFWDHPPWFLVEKVLTKWQRAVDLFRI